MDWDFQLSTPSPTTLHSISSISIHRAFANSIHPYQRALSILQGAAGVIVVLAISIRWRFPHTVAPPFTRLFSFFNENVAWASRERPRSPRIYLVTRYATQDLNSKASKETSAPHLFTFECRLGATQESGSFSSIKFREGQEDGYSLELERTIE